MRPFSQPLSRLPLGAFSCILVWFIWMLVQGTTLTNCRSFDFRTAPLQGALVEQPVFSQLSEFVSGNEEQNFSACIYLAPETSFQDLMSLFQLASENQLQLRVEEEYLVLRQRR